MSTSCCPRCARRWRARKNFGSLRQNGHHLQRALDERREISIAVGILMERLQVERQHAFETLRKTARAQRRRIEDVASDMMTAAVRSRPAG
jgi:AmiR/NasT family two-component response regulator